MTTEEEIQENQSREKEARWLSDLETLKKHHSKFQRDKDGYLIKDTKENAEGYMRVLPENSDKYIDMCNEKIRKEKEVMQEEGKNKPFLIEDFLIIILKENGDVKSKKVNVDKFVEYLMEKFSFKTIYGSKSEEIFVYEDGIYLKNGRSTIQTQTENILKEYSTNHYINEIQEKIKRLSTISKEEFDKIPEHLICLKNGILNLKIRELEKHNPKYYFKTRFNIKYDKKADCKNIKEFFNGIFYPEDINFVQEWFGFNLYRKYFVKKAVICFGERDTGKTIFLNLLMNFIGRENTAGISLQRIASGDKFALSSLKDKYSNIFDDLSSKDLSDQGGFKIATGGGFITAEHKFGDPFQFLNFAKHIFATNKIPSIEDVDDDAYYDRWIPLPFDNQIEKSEQDKFLIQKLTTDQEMSGLLNYALEGLERLLKKGEFSYNKNCKEIKEIMERHSDPLSAFAQDWLIEKLGNKITKEQMFQIYSIYCKEKNTARLTKNQLGRRLGKKISYALEKRDKERFWENVDIRKLNINIDTLDTLLKIICNDLEKGNNTLSSDYSYIISGDASNVSSNTGKPSENDFKKLKDIQNKIISGEITNQEAEELLKK